MASPHTIKELLAQEEITLKDAWFLVKRSVRINWIWITACLGIFVVVGYVAAVTTQEEFEGQAVVLTEQKAAAPSLGALGSLLGAAGPTSSGGFGPEMYGDIIESQPFLSELVTTKLPKGDNVKDSITLIEYFQDEKHDKQNAITLSVKWLKGIPGSITGLFHRKPPAPPAPVVQATPPVKKEVVIQKDTVKPVESELQKNTGAVLEAEEKKAEILRKEQTGVVQTELSTATIRSTQIPPIVQIDGVLAGTMNIVKNRISLDAKERKIQLTVKMPEPLMSALVCKLVLEKLMEYISTYKTAKQRDNLIFLENRKADAEVKYKTAQMRLAGYKDNSLGLIMQSVQTREQILQNEMNLAFTVYNELAGQVEQARIDLKKETPLFTSLDPITIPGAKSEPIVSKIVFKYFSIGFLMSMILLIFTMLGFVHKKKIKSA